MQSQILLLALFQRTKWWKRRDLNSQPDVCKTPALPIKLRPHKTKKPDNFCYRAFPNCHIYTMTQEKPEVAAPTVATVVPFPVTIIFIFILFLKNLQNPLFKTVMVLLAWIVLLQFLSYLRFLLQFENPQTYISIPFQVVFLLQ